MIMGERIAAGPIIAEFALSSDGELEGFWPFSRVSEGDGVTSVAVGMGAACLSWILGSL